MKASELRIGNLVKSIGIEYVVSQIDGNSNIKGVEGGTSFNLDKTAQPIPLTEEWLLKLGAKKLSDNFFEIGYLKFKIHSHQYGIDFHFGNGGEHYIKPHYVHSLQNLYFALTGEELTIK